MSGFSLAWLRQREPFDLAARDQTCMQRFAARLQQSTHRPLHVLDLASGSGASLRALAPVIGVDHIWTLTDNDAGLLATQKDALSGWAVTSGWTTMIVPLPSERIDIDTGDALWIALAKRIDLDRQLDELDFATVDAVTTSAFLDLVSQAWLDRFAEKLAASSLPLLAMLSVDGRRLWYPELPDDAAVLAAFEQHQAGEKGFGPALGPAAAPYLAAILRSSGYDVTLVRSDWEVGQDARAMLGPLLDDTLRAACEARPDEASRFARWGATRREQLAAGRLSLAVGHLDLLALPMSLPESSR